MPLDPFSANFLSSLAANLATQLLNGAGKRTRELLTPTAKQQALTRCTQSGIVALTVTATAAEKEHAAHLADIFEKFFNEPEVGKELARLVRGEKLNRDDLAYLFKDAGYDAKTLPLLNFEQALTAFEAAFLSAAVEEPELRDILQAAEMLKQTHLQTDMLAAVRDLRDFLRQAHAESLSIQAGVLTALLEKDNKPARYEFPQQLVNNSGLMINARDVSVGGDLVNRDKITVAQKGTAVTGKRAKVATERGIVGEIFNDSFMVSGEVVNSTFNLYLSKPGKATLDKPAFEHMLTEYLRWVGKANSTTKLFGVESLRTSGGNPVRQLAEVFVPLSLRRFRPLKLKKQRVKKGEELAAKRAYLEKIEQQQGKNLQVPLANLLKSGKRLAIIGGAGTGKSTVLAYFATALAASAARGEAPPFWLPAQRKVLVPLLIPLRHYREYLRLSKQAPQDRLRRPQTGKLAAFASWYLQQRCPAFERCEDFFERLLLGGGCLLMLDGLGEVVSREERGLVRQEVEDIAHDMYPDNWIIVTARESGYQDNAVFGDDFTRLDVQWLEEEQVRALVRNWCRQLYPGEEQARTDDIMSSIDEINALRRERDLPPLISTPLMTTMVVSVKWGETELPRERAKLYEAAVKVILQAQYIPETQARKELVDWGGPWEEQRDWLAQLALTMHQGGHAAAAIPEEQVRAALRDKLSPRNLERFIQASRYRGGLFEERAELFQFLHLTFQEFLAARCLAKQRNAALPVLEPRVADPWWREVLLLTYGFAQADYVPFAAEFLHWLSTRPGQGEEALAGLELAAAAVLELEKPKRKLRLQHAKLLAQAIIHPQSEAPAKLRVRSAETLARLGDSRLEVTSLEHMEFCLVPGGPFHMGHSKEGGEAKPHLNEKLNYDYWLARFPVTVAQYALFVEATQHKPYDPYRLQDPLNRPVREVTWHEAQKFCNWLTKQWRAQNVLPKNWRVQLPSEAEWEKAARGGLQVPQPAIIRPINNVLSNVAPVLVENAISQRVYPWGNKKDANRANYDDTKIGDTSAVGCFPSGASPYGCEEMAGNVLEWTRSLWGKHVMKPEFKYPYDPNDRRENLQADHDILRVVRGGAFHYSSGFVRCSHRYRINPDEEYDDLGFRIALSL